jgi:hypothetical protein
VRRYGDGTPRGEELDPPGIACAASSFGGDDLGWMWGDRECQCKKGAGKRPASWRESALWATTDAQKLSIARRLARSELMTVDTWFSHMVRFLDAYDLGWSYWVFGPTHARANKLWFGGFDHAGDLDDPSTQLDNPEGVDASPVSPPVSPGDGRPLHGSTAPTAEETRIGVGTVQSAEADAAALRTAASEDAQNEAKTAATALRRAAAARAVAARVCGDATGWVYFHTVLCHTTDFPNRQWRRCAGEGEVCFCPGGVVRYGDGHRVPRYSSTELAQAAEAQCDQPGSEQSVLGPDGGVETLEECRALCAAEDRWREAQARGDDDAAPTCEFFTFRAAEKRCVWKQGCPDGLPARTPTDGGGSASGTQFHRLVRAPSSDDVEPARWSHVEVVPSSLFEGSVRRGARAEGKIYCGHDKSSRDPEGDLFGATSSPFRDVAPGAEKHCECAPPPAVRAGATIEFDCSGLGGQCSSARSQTRVGAEGMWRYNDDGYSIMRMPVNLHDLSSWHVPVVTKLELLRAVSQLNNH